MADDLSTKIEVFGEMPSAAGLKAFATAVCQDLYSVEIENLAEIEDEDLDSDVKTERGIKTAMLALSAAEKPFVINAYSHNGCVENIVEAAKKYGIHVKFEIEGYAGDAPEMFFVKPNDGKGYESMHVPMMGDEIGMTISQIEKLLKRGVTSTEELLGVMRGFAQPGPEFVIPDSVIDELSAPRRRPK